MVNRINHFKIIRDCYSWFHVQADMDPNRYVNGILVMGNQKFYKWARLDARDKDKGFGSIFKPIKIILSQHFMCWKRGESYVRGHY